MALSKQENLNISNSSGTHPPFNPLGGKKVRRASKKPPKLEGGDPLLDVEEAARYLSVSSKLVRGYAKAGLLKPVPLPGRLVTETIAKLIFRRSDLDAFVRKAMAR